MNKLIRLFLFAMVFLAVIGAAHAAGSKLIFSDVDVKVGSKTSKNLNDKDIIDDEAEPGDTVEFRVETSNNFTSAEDLKIEDISITVTIGGIDDSDDLEEESQDFNLNQGRDKKITLKFQTPIEVDEDSFDVTIHAEGEDENGTDHEADMRLTLEVNKESHLLKITRSSLSPAEISCNRKNVQVATSIINIGNEDEEDIMVQILNSDLGVDLSQDVTELTAEPNEDESRFSHIFAFSVPNDIEAGSYPIVVRVLYDENRKKSEQTATLTVSDCGTIKQTEASTSETSEGQDVTVITPSNGKTTTTVVQPSAPAGTTVTSESLFKSNAFVTGIIIAEIIAVIVGIILIVNLFRRRA